MALKNIIRESKKLNMLYAYSIEILKEELDRYDRTERKATLYFTIISALIGIYGIFINRYIFSFVLPNSYFSLYYFLIIFVIGSWLFIEMIMIWFELLESIKFRILFSRPLHSQFLAWAKIKSIQEIENYFINKNKEAIIQNKKEKQIKIQMLESAHKRIKKMITLISILMFLLVINEIIVKNLDKWIKILS